MNIQSIGANAQPRQVYAERNERAGAPPQATTQPAASNASNAVEEKYAATPADSNKAVEKNKSAIAPEKLNEAVKNINKQLQSLAQDIEFKIDDDTNITVIKVVDRKTKEILRQIPSDEALEIAKALDNVHGLLIKQKA
ncbi:flagellar protein FlaG [Massilia sp. W12]|uniref:flagellar protein FlaG n=1 Tax=Massilia sp. W12 TaxID=3126507 RepID=UPI0030CE0BD8